MSRSPEPEAADIDVEDVELLVDAASLSRYFSPNGGLRGVQKALSKLQNGRTLPRPALTAEACIMKYRQRSVLVVSGSKSWHISMLAGIRLEMRTGHKAISN